MLLPPVPTTQNKRKRVYLKRVKKRRRRALSSFPLVSGLSFLVHKGSKIKSNDERISK